MHDHETCEELMAHAKWAGLPGRLEYLATRCDRLHGDTTDLRALMPAPNTTEETNDDE